LKTQHQITAITINKVSVFLNEIISVNDSKTEADVFNAIVLKCLCNVFILKKWENNL